jgi:hypothetical protein
VLLVIEAASLLLLLQGRLIEDAPRARLANKRCREGVVVRKRGLSLSLRARAVTLCGDVRAWVVMMLMLCESVRMRSCCCCCESGGSARERRAFLRAATTTLMRRRRRRSRFVFFLIESSGC